MSFLFNDTATTEIYTLSLHDALPISRGDVVPDQRGELRRPGGHPEGDPAHHQPGLRAAQRRGLQPGRLLRRGHRPARVQDRKSTRLNSSHANISYAVFCLKKKSLTKN